MKFAQSFRIATACLLVLLMSSCAPNEPLQQPESPSKLQAQSLDSSNSDVRIPLLNIGQVSYVPLQELVKTVGYQLTPGETDQQLLIGEIDPTYEITIGTKQASKEGESLLLSDPPLLHNGKPYVPATVLSDLFAQDIDYRIENNDIVVRAQSHGGETMEDIGAGMSMLSTEPFFADAVGGEGDGFVALASVNMDKLVATARRYMGTPYLFGAKPYSVSRKFDCSSFTQYIFGKYGVNLPRVARSQAKQGKPVSKQSLRKGDLVFFSVPGRFKSNKTVGHVGIYIGNGQMINTYSDKQGVHIANINKGYWAKQYLSARRIVS